MVTVERLTSILEYDQHTGIFVWSQKISNKTIIGRVAGYLRVDGYRSIMIDKQNYQAHRLAWLYMTNEWPKKQIDHINMDKSDNRWINLRLATRAQNNANRRIYANNKSGFKGVSWAEDCRKWQAQIVIDRRNKYLGLFDTPEAAHAAYCDAARKYFGEFARTS